METFETSKVFLKIFFYYPKNKALPEMNSRLRIHDFILVADAFHVNGVKIILNKFFA